MENHVDVVVVGAGPVGLLTAIELKLGEAKVLVLERLATPSTTMKAMSVGPLGGEALQRRGMGEAIAAIKTFTDQAVSQLPARPSKFSGHFAGLSLIRKDAQREPARRPHMIDQPSLEVVLGDRSSAVGIEVRRECEVTGFVQDANGVEVEWTSPSGVDRIRCSYLVGCDGGRSSIRRMAGFDFPGTPPTMTMYQAIAELDHPERLPSLGWHRTSGGVFACGPFPGRLLMLDFSGPPKDRDAPVTREEIETVFRRISSADVRVKELKSGSRWTDNTRLVDTYRRGRVLLAGDAAHVHSPFGGQGLNLGLVDAANLGWKLAAIIRGDMPESLLDTYTAERRPVAEGVLANTLAQVAIMRPDPQSGAMRDILANLMQFDDVNRLIGEMMTGLSTRYDLGSELDDVGRLVGNKPIQHGLSLYDVMQEGQGVFLDASPEGRASNLVATNTQSIRCVPVATGPSMLVRPDACIAWIGERSSTDGLESALNRWFCTSPG